MTSRTVTTDDLRRMSPAELRDVRRQTRGRLSRGISDPAKAANARKLIQTVTELLEGSGRPLDQRVEDAREALYGSRSRTAARQHARQIRAGMGTD